MKTIVAASPKSSAYTALAGRISSMGRSVADCIKVMADHYAAAVRYEQLSRLSSAELQRRGLSRATLARDVLAACDHPPP
jgi:hypothetical protein